MTFEEFLAWCDEDTWAEWVDGEVQLLLPRRTRDAEIAGFLTTLLHIYAEQCELGETMNAPFLMRLPELSRARAPDLFFVRRERAHLFREYYLDGPADLVVEIVSPESIGRDRGEKFAEYEMGGVREYWLIYPDRQVAEFYWLGSDGRYRMMPVGADGIYRSQVVPGFWLRVEWLWQEPLPLEVDVLRELKVV